MNKKEFNVANLKKCFCGGSGHVSRNILCLNTGKVSYNFYCDGKCGLASMDSETIGGAAKKWNELQCSISAHRAELKYPDSVLMPRELTAENGAKGLLSGEFSEPYHVFCPECYGDGCGECLGEGGETVRISVSWSTIKEIYRKIVNNIGKDVVETKG